MKKGFTLIELLVVIGIIGVLAGVMMTSFSGGTESARAAKCLTNMRNLAQGWISAGAADTTWRKYPAAGSHEYVEVDSSRRNPRPYYQEIKGWISWNSKGAYRGHDTSSHQASGSWMISAYSTDREQRLFCLTNGAIWKFVGGNSSTYVCPLHAKAMNLKTPPIWSYLMNSAMGWDYSEGSQTVMDQRKTVGSLACADKTLLFSEMPFSGIGSWQPSGEGGGTECDCVLQFNGSIVNDKSPAANGHENIGVNHKNGKNLCAHVAFADGHTEKLRIPFTGNVKKPNVDDGMLRDITAWLCKGIDISFDGKTYRKAD